MYDLLLLLLQVLSELHLRKRILAMFALPISIVNLIVMDTKVFPAKTFCYKCSRVTTHEIMQERIKHLVKHRYLETKKCLTCSLTRKASYSVWYLPKYKYYDE